MTKRQAEIIALDALAAIADSRSGTLPGHRTEKEALAYRKFSNELQRKANNLRETEERVQGKKAGLIPKASLRKV